VGQVQGLPSSEFMGRILAPLLALCSSDRIDQVMPDQAIENVAPGERS
jgi:hypothetical protein